MPILNFYLSSRACFYACEASTIATKSSIISFSPRRAGSIPAEREDLFGTCRASRPGCEGLAQGLASLGECTVDDLEDQFAISIGLLPTIKAHECGVNVRDRPEDTPGNQGAAGRFRVPGSLDRGDTVDPGSRLGCQSFGHFQLDHDIDDVETGKVLEGREDRGDRDVVWQVCHEVRGHEGVELRRDRQLIVGQL